MGDLMAGIQAGKGRLKKVSEKDIEENKAKSKDASAGMFGGAVKAIMARRAALSVDSDSEENEEEWD